MDKTRIPSKSSSKSAFSSAISLIKLEEIILYITWNLSEIFGNVLTSAVLQDSETVQSALSCFI